MQQERGKSKLCRLAVVALVLWNEVVAQEPGTVQLKPDPETAAAHMAAKSKDLTKRGIPVSAKVKLHPDPDSEVLVPEFNLIRLADGSIVAEGKYSGNRDVQFSYVIDPVAETYRTFEIDTWEGQARFGAYLKSGVLPRRLNPGESIKAKRILGEFNPADSGFNNAAQPEAAPSGGPDRTDHGCASCWGQNTLVVRTIDILNITLAETASWISYFFDNPCSAVCNHFVNGYGSCYANPDTGLSHWLMDLCAKWPNDLQILTDGEYHNDDFLGVCGRTNVVHIAEVTINQYSGPNYWWQHLGNGLCYSALFAVVMSGGINTCW
jgi:hypothetical protein